MKIKNIPLNGTQDNCFDQSLATCQRSFYGTHVYTREGEHRRPVHTRLGKWDTGQNLVSPFVNHLHKKLTFSVQFDDTLPSFSYCSRVAGLRISSPDCSISSFDTVGGLTWPKSSASSLRIWNRQSILSIIVKIETYDNASKESREPSGPMTIGWSGG